MHPSDLGNVPSGMSEHINSSQHVVGLSNLSFSFFFFFLTLLDVWTLEFTLG